VGGDLGKRIAYYDRYQPIYGTDKAAFIRRYATTKRHPSSFDVDIQRYKGTQGDILAEDQTHNVKFIHIGAFLRLALLLGPELVPCFLRSCRLLAAQSGAGQPLRPLVPEAHGSAARQLANGSRRVVSMIFVLTWLSEQDLKSLHEFFTANTARLLVKPESLDQLHDSIRLLEALKKVRFVSEPTPVVQCSISCDYRRSLPLRSASILLRKATRRSTNTTRLA
jgi:hypothetical protein